MRQCENSHIIEVEWLGISFVHESEGENLLNGNNLASREGSDVAMIWKFSFHQ